MAAFDAVVTDLDGTVVRADGTVSDATLLAARTLAERGVPLLAATARTPAGVTALEELAPHLAFAVCCSGAVGWVPGAATPAWCERLPRDTMTDLIGFLTRELPAAAMAAFDNRQWRMNAAYQVMRPNTHRGPIAAMADAPAEVLAAATHRTASVEDDGFARTLESLGLLTPA
ncbi:HAD family hydrolase [Paractinoplanes hotanensis]|uniref:HAD hydrolase family protein n=1 Tax=Paractinoplanes hotanensis TaxID=2906497 RepID=A0ABT0Y8N2_9ACTN|nr:HAD hydrolase family protein [Actinoplanes hotanensis]MCM4082392.1 HAD hydrolase family protein [Actinoplanes hotanensis]